MSLSEINLLPQREKRSFLYIGSLVAIFLAIVIISFLIIKYQSEMTQLENAKRELESVTSLRAVEEKRVNGSFSLYKPLQDYASFAKWLPNQLVSPVKVIDYLSSLLPQKGYFLQYNFQDQGQVSVAAQFSTLEEVAAYYHHLQSSEWLEKVELTSVNNHETTIRANFILSLSSENFLSKNKGDR